MGDYSELKRLADRVISDRRFCGDEIHKALADGVMALIAENEFLTESRQEAREERNKIGDRHDALEAERDQLKAENEALRKSVAGKVVCPMELFQDLRDSASEEAAQYRAGGMAEYRPRRMYALDKTVTDCDELIAAMGKVERS